MSNPLLKTLLGEPTTAQVAGGVMMIVLFVSVGAVAAAAMAVAARRLLSGRFEQLFWAMLLFAIAAFYLGFAAWFQAAPAAWETELIAIGLFAGVALIGVLSPKVLALGYLLHGVWDVAHSLFGGVIVGHAASDIPLGYGMFCVGFDFAAAVYLLGWARPVEVRGSAPGVSVPGTSG